MVSCLSHNQFFCLYPQGVNITQLEGNAVFVGGKGKLYVPKQLCGKEGGERSSDVYIANWGGGGGRGGIGIQITGEGREVVMGTLVTGMSRSSSMGGGRKIVMCAPYRLLGSEVVVCT